MKVYVLINTYADELGSNPIGGFYASFEAADRAVVTTAGDGSPLSNEWRVDRSGVSWSGPAHRIEEHEVQE